MTTRIKLSVLAGAGLAAMAFAGSVATAAGSDTAPIQAMEARFAKAVQARDLNGVMSNYSADVLVFDVSPPRQYVGAAAYRKDWQGLFASLKGPIQFKVSDLHVQAGRDLAYAHSIQALSSTDAKSGKPMSITVRVTDVFQKSAGAWKIIHEHVSMPVDLATGKADMQSRP